MGRGLLPQGHWLSRHRAGAGILNPSLGAQSALPCAAPRLGLTEQLRAATEAYLALAEPLFRAARRHPLKGVEIRFDLGGQSAGQAIYRGQHCRIRYNLQIARHQPDAFIARTVPHEVAHLVAHICHGGVRPHGPEWRAVMTFFGIPQAERCHSFDLGEMKIRRQLRWSYACGCATHQLSTTRHNRIQQGGQSYLCRHCRQPLRLAGEASPDLHSL